MPGVYYKIVSAQEGVCARTGTEMFAKLFIAEAQVASKLRQREVVVDTLDLEAVARGAAELSEAHERDSGDAEIIALDAASVLACANHRLSIVVASYDLFDDVERIAQAAQCSANALRVRLHTALCRAGKVLVVEGEAARMAWLHLDREWSSLPLPPLPAFSTPTHDTTSPIVIVLHHADAAATKLAADFQALHPNSVVLESRGVEREAVAPSQASLVVHIGRDTSARGGLRLVDCWASGVPVVQLVSRLTDRRPEEDASRLSANTVTHNETGLLASSFADLLRRVSTMMNDPILVSTIARRARVETSKQIDSWREAIRRTLFVSSHP